MVAYALGEPLRGHEGDVHHGTDAAGNPVIVARFELGAEGSAQLQRDASACQALGHPSVVAPIDVVARADGVTLVFERVEGATLHHVLTFLDERNEVLSDGASLKIGAVIAEAMHAAHTAKGADGRIAPLVHAQLGPHQIYLLFDGRVRLLGLGMGTAFRTAAARHDVRPELRSYVAPECSSGGALTVRANVYSLGVLLWRLLSRKPLPTSTERLPWLRSLRPDLPALFTSLVDRALEPSMLQRTVSAFQIMQAISRTGLADAPDLRWNLELFGELEGFGDAGLMHSFPPAQLSDVPPDSVQPVSDDPFDSEPTHRIDMGPIRASLGSLDWSLDDEDPPAGDGGVGAPSERRPTRLFGTQKPKPGLSEEESHDRVRTGLSTEPSDDGARGYLDVPPMPTLTPQMEATRERIARASHVDLPRELVQHALDGESVPSDEAPETRRADTTAERNSRDAEARVAEDRSPLSEVEGPRNVLELTPAQVLVGGVVAAAVSAGLFAAGFVAGVAQGEQPSATPATQAGPSVPSTLDDVTAATPTSPPSAMETAPSASVSAAPSVSASAAPSVSASSSASAAASASATVKERPPLRPGQAWLFVETDLTDAGVYVNGRFAGRPNQDLVVPCGVFETSGSGAIPAQALAEPEPRLPSEVWRCPDARARSRSSDREALVQPAARSPRQAALSSGQRDANSGARIQPREGHMTAAHCRPRAEVGQPAVARRCGPGREARAVVFDLQQQLLDGGEAYPDETGAAVPDGVAYALLHHADELDGRGLRRRGRSHPRRRTRELRKARRAPERGPPRSGRPRDHGRPWARRGPHHGAGVVDGVAGALDDGLETRRRSRVEHGP